MLPVLLIMSLNPPRGSWPGWYTVWCPPASAADNVSDADETVVLPAGDIAPLCAALLVCGRWLSSAPLALTTEPEILLPSFRKKRAEARLIEANRGTLIYPTRELAQTCIKSAIRQHNPASGPVTLIEGWHQARLLSCNGDSHYD